jgi:predicted neuraminidase
MINNTYKILLLKFILILLFIIYSLLLINKNDISHHKTAFFIAKNNVINQTKQLPYFKVTNIPQPKFLKSAHSASVDSLGNNQLIATWFAGSHEGAPDVKIWQSFYQNDTWTMAKAVVDKELIANSLKVLVRKVGNPVVYRSYDGTLYLFVVYVSFGGWSGSKVVYFKSYDNGLHWLAPKPIILSAVFNISNLIRTNAISLQDGSFYLPIYHEVIFKYPELAYFDKNGNFIEMRKIKNALRVIQPSFVPINQRIAYIYLRNHMEEDLPLYMQTSYDYGYSWSHLIKTNIENQDSSLATIRLPSGLLVMVRNLFHRNNLIVSASKDGYHWFDVFSLEKGIVHDEFSYPSIKYSDGYINILYTWQRKNIKHVRFNLAWLEQQLKNRGYND